MRVSNAWLLTDHPYNVNWWKWFTNVVLIHHGWGKVSLYMMIIYIYTNFVLLSYLCSSNCFIVVLLFVLPWFWAGISELYLSWPVGCCCLRSAWLKFVLILCVCLHEYCVHLMFAVPMEFRRGHWLSWDWSYSYEQPCGCQSQLPASLAHNHL